MKLEYTPLLFSLSFFIPIGQELVSRKSMKYLYIIVFMLIVAALTVVFLFPLLDREFVLGINICLMAGAVFYRFKYNKVVAYDGKSISVSDFREKIYILVVISFIVVLLLKIFI